MATPTITIIVRHAADCKYSGDEFYKGCKCRKALRWFANGKQHRQSAGTRSWSQAEDERRRLEDQLAGRVTSVPEEGTALSTAVETFLASKQSQGLAYSSMTHHKTGLTRLMQYCAAHGVHTVHLLNLDLLTRYRATWDELYPRSSTRARVQADLKVFLGFCVDAGWLVKLPKLSPIKVTESETMPLTEKEYADLLAAVPKAFKHQEDRMIVRGVVQLMRWSGLAVHDASTIRRDAVVKDGRVSRVILKRQKTGIDVSVPIPPAVAADLAACMQNRSDYVFWDAPLGGKPVSFSHQMSLKISKLFDVSGIQTLGFMKSHRLRDTCAVDMLQKGVPMEEVSKLLGHNSIRTTEKHYAKWAKGRQDRLDKLVKGTWRVAE